MSADVLVENQGSIAIFTPMTPAAREWTAENVQVEDWQRMGCSIACEPRCMADLVKRMQESGLVVE